MASETHPSDDGDSERLSRLLIVVATYNERENLPKLVEAIFGSAPEGTLLVIDDQSPDGTGDWAQEHARREPRLRVLSRSGKQGLGSAILTAMRIAIEEDFEFLLNLDADFSHDPAAIPKLVHGLLNRSVSPPVDVAIGSRYIAGGRTEGWPWHRRWMSRGVNLYARWWLRLPARDCSSGFRCFRVAALRRLDLSALRATGYAFHEESLWRLKRAEARIAEFPITFVDRRYGSSKINFREAWIALYGIWRWGWQERFTPSRP